MIRLLVLAFIVAFPLVAAAVPIPKELEREEFARLFGTPNDPTEQAEFAFERQKLIVRLAKPTGNNRTGLKFPHTLRPVTGDFVLQVKVSYPLQKRQ